VRSTPAVAAPSGPQHHPPRLLTMSRKSTLRTGIAVAGAAAALVLVPGSASAAFDADHSDRCENATTIAGIGASFQRDAQLAWGATLLDPAPGAQQNSGFGASSLGCAEFSVTGTQDVTYEPRGSGDGRNAFGANTAAGSAGVRNTNYAFGGADEPPTTAQLAAANNGPDGVVGGGDDAVLQTIPVAQSSIAVDVRLPDGCSVAQTPATTRSISRAALAGAFAASTSYDTWGEILPNISGAGCAAKSFKRVVRLDSSGTTFGFKRYLAAIDPATYTGLANTAWPNDSGTTTVLRGAVNGAGSQLDALNAQSANGGIGYADLATSRDKAFDWNGSTDTSFWLNVERADGTPTSPARVNTTSSTSDRGANCTSAQYADAATGTLPTTTQSWANVDATATTANYAICALTYALAWKNPSQANVGRAAGRPEITQGQARAVRDYLGYVTTNATGGGQTLLPGAGYQALPAPVLSAAQAGAGALDY
jgi:hypothetical protein